MNTVSTGIPAREISVGFLLIENFALLSYATAVEPLRAANTLAGRQLYKWVHISVGGGPVHASNGISVSSDYKVGQIPQIDRLFVCAGGNPASFRHQPTFRWLKQLGRKGMPICGVSGGPYLLARAGLLDGYRFTIHWEHLPAFIEDFPNLQPTRGLYAIDRGRLTCGGGLSALDMMHEMIEGDFGAPLANAVSRWFLQTEVRSGDSPQRPDVPARLAGVSSRLQDIFEDIEDNLEEPLSRRALAARAGLSIRQLDRLFRASVSMSVRAYYLAARLDRAQMLLLQTNMTVLDIAVACGFQSASHFSRVYKTHFGHPPLGERRARGATLLARR
jgi:transcriptional regulator GlxA family with amidase domain